MNRLHIKHANFGWLHKPPLPPASCHCLVIQSDTNVVLIDTGIGMHDIANPEDRIGRDAIDAAGFKFIPKVTAIQQLLLCGIDPSRVSDIVLTHCDSDHVGGLSDFPDANVHVSFEEKLNVYSGNPRYNLRQFGHGPKWQTYAENDCVTLGLPSRRVKTELDVDMRLIPLFGQTNGHCGVCVCVDGLWVLHVGDAYYLRDELINKDHPINKLATLRADNDELRKQTLDSLRTLTSQHSKTLTFFGYHDITELPSGIPTLEEVA